MVPAPVQYRAGSRPCRSASSSWPTRRSVRRPHAAGDVDDRLGDVGGVGLGVGQGHAGELDRPLDDEARVELDVAELEVAAAGLARLWRDAALPQEASPQSRLVLARGVATRGTCP